MIAYRCKQCGHDWGGVLRKPSPVMNRIILFCPLCERMIGYEEPGPTPGSIIRTLHPSRVDVPHPSTTDTQS